MSRILTYPFVIPPSDPVYAVVMNGSSVYNFVTNAFVPQATYAGVTDWTPYAKMLTDVSTGSDSSIFTATLPDELPAGNYLIVLRSRMGVAPADDDGVLGFFTQSILAVTAEEEEEISEELPESGLFTDEQILEKLNQAKEITVDNQTVIEHSISDLLKADRYAANKKVSGNGWASVMRARAVPPSALGD